MLRKNSFSTITIVLVSIVFVQLLLVQNSVQRTTSPGLSDEEIKQKIPRNFQEFRESAKKPGLEIWRVEAFKLVPIALADHGKFFSGDSYLILWTEMQNRKLFSKIYYWIGKNSTQDEYGAVAIYALNLRQHLGDQPSTKREDQNQESTEFRKLFSNKLVYMDGGVATGFRTVNTEFEKQLYLVKGKRNIRVKPVRLSVDSLNQNDSFVLDTAKHIYIFNGKFSSNLERLKSQTFSSRLADDHSGRAVKIEIDENNFDTFLKELNVVAKKGTKITDHIKTRAGNLANNDIDFEKNFVQNLQLIRVMEKDQKISIDKVAEKQLTQMQLQTDDCFVLKDGDRALFAWIGKKCNSRERAETQKRFANAKKVLEKSEPASFIEYFNTWKAAGELNARLI